MELGAIHALPAWRLGGSGAAGGATAPTDSATATAGSATAAASSATAAAGSVQRDVSGSLTITTRDGDTVTLSASLDTSVAFGAASGGGSSARSLVFGASRSLSVQVQGNLDPRERHDIARVVRTFLHDLAAMADGKDVSLANVGAGHARSLASVAATSDVETQVTLGVATVAPGGGGGGGPVSGEPDVGGQSAPAPSAIGDPVRGLALPASPTPA